ncbi:hypothetical protein BJX76DRAFT_13813 [Aspergillus varians]
MGLCSEPWSPLIIGSALDPRSTAFSLPTSTSPNLEPSFPPNLAPPYASPTVCPIPLFLGTLAVFYLHCRPVLESLLSDNLFLLSSSGLVVAPLLLPPLRTTS